MYYINITDLETNKSWKEKFDSYYIFRKRVIKLEHSKKLFITSRSNLWYTIKHKNNGDRKIKISK